MMATPFEILPNVQGQRRVVLHANDWTTDFLQAIYVEGDMILDESYSDEMVREAIRQSDVVVLLGHGTHHGLFFFNREGLPDMELNHVLPYLGLRMIDSKYADLLRQKTVIAIFCHAADFGQANGLHGLFTGMVASEVDEAYACRIHLSEYEEENMELMNQRYIADFRDCLDHNELSCVPAAMVEKIQETDPESELVNYNYHSMTYLK